MTSVRRLCGRGGVHLAGDRIIGDAVDRPRLDAVEQAGFYSIPRETATLFVQILEQLADALVQPKGDVRLALPDADVFHGVAPRMLPSF